MKTAIITGSSRGIGKALGEALLERGINVVFSSSSRGEAARCCSTLAKGKAEAIGVDCDVRCRADIGRLWDTAEQHFGAVDVWVNNAGLALGGVPFAQTSDADMQKMLDINIKGTLYGCQTAIERWKAAHRSGAIYNMLGAGADGQLVPGMSLYAMTKVAITYLTRALAAEMSQDGNAQILIGAFSPGLVITEGFLRELGKSHGGMSQERKLWVNRIADHPETIGRWAAKIIHTNQQQGRIAHWLTPAKIRARGKLPQRDILGRYGL